MGTQVAHTFTFIHSLVLRYFMEGRTLAKNFFIEEKEYSRPKTNVNFKGPKTSIISMIDSNLRSERDVLTTSQIEPPVLHKNTVPKIQFTPRQLKPPTKSNQILKSYLNADRAKQGKSVKPESSPRKREFEKCKELERKLTECKRPKIDESQTNVDPMLWRPDVARGEGSNSFKVSYNQQKGKNKIMSKFLKDVQAFHESDQSSNGSEPEYVPGLYGLNTSFNC